MFHHLPHLAFPLSWVCTSWDCTSKPDPGILHTIDIANQDPGKPSTVSRSCVAFALALKLLIPEVCHTFGDIFMVLGGLSRCPAEMVTRICLHGYHEHHTQAPFQKTLVRAASFLWMSRPQHGPYLMSLAPCLIHCAIQAGYTFLLPIPPKNLGARLTSACFLLGIR